MLPFPLCPPASHCSQPSNPSASSPQSFAALVSVLKQRGMKWVCATRRCKSTRPAERRGTLHHSIFPQQMQFARWSWMGICACFYNPKEQDKPSSSWEPQTNCFLLLPRPPLPWGHSRTALMGPAEHCRAGARGRVGSVLLQSERPQWLPLHTQRYQKPTGRG